MKSHIVLLKSLHLAELQCLHLESKCVCEGAGNFPVVGCGNIPEIVTGKLSQPNMLRHMDKDILYVGSVFTLSLIFFFWVMRPVVSLCIYPSICSFTHSFNKTLLSISNQGSEVTRVQKIGVAAFGSCVLVEDTNNKCINK